MYKAFAVAVSSLLILSCSGCAYDMKPGQYQLVAGDHDRVFLVATNDGRVYELTTDKDGNDTWKLLRDHNGRSGDERKRDQPTASPSN